MISVSDIQEIAGRKHIENVKHRSACFASAYRSLQNWLKKPTPFGLNIYARRRFEGVYCDGLLSIDHGGAYISAVPQQEVKP